MLVAVPRAFQDPGRSVPKPPLLLQIRSELPLGTSPASQERSASRPQDGEGAFAVKLRSAPEDLARTGVGRLEADRRFQSAPSATTNSTPFLRSRPAAVSSQSGTFCISCLSWGQDEVQDWPLGHELGWSCGAA